jgi:branched-subunit amino acid transport protein
MNWEHAVIIVGLALISLVTRAFFLLPARDIPMPAWLRKGFRFAPIAALVAVVAPEVLVPQGQLISSWQDPRLAAALAGAAYYFWRRGILGTLLVGMLVMWGLRFGLGWV